MAYNFIEKRETRQKAAAFAAYMIIGSYFNKETCRNQFIVDNLYLYYKEQGIKNQELMESNVITQAERILKKYEALLALMNCESLIHIKDGRYKIDFLIGFESVHVEVDKRGRFEIQVKEEC